MPWKEVSIMSQRLEFVTLASAAKANIRHLCRCYGISSATAYKWLHRFHSTGVNGLEDRSRRPHHSPSRSVVEMEEAIIDLRLKHPAWGGRKLRARLLALDHAAVPSSSTITAILRRHQLLDPKESAKHQAFQRYERAAPNELWQMDFKGEFKLPHGRCYPLTILDDHSRFAIALQACARNTRNITQTALIQVFRRYGLPDRITCDNGSPWGSGGRSYYTALGVWLMRLGIGVSHSRPHHPQTQGKDERFHRTLEAELLRYSAATLWLSGNGSLINGVSSTTLSVPMKRSPWQCRHRAINLVAVVIRNSYQRSNTDRLTLFAKSATLVTSNMKAASTMSVVPSMVFMWLYGKPPVMTCSKSFSVTIKLASLIFETTN